MSEERIVRRTLDDRRKGKTDWARVAAQTDEEILANIASDPDAAPFLDEEWFAHAEVVLPQKRAISIRLDNEVLDYFQKGGTRYQTRINAVLRAYVDAQKKRDKGAA